jgi:hypothetical protein
MELATDITLETMEFVKMANFLGMPSLSLPVGFAAPETNEARGLRQENVPIRMMGMAE